MPAGADHDHQVGRFESSERITGPPLPQLLPSILRVGGGEVLHRIVNEQNLEPVTGDRLTGRGPGDDAATLRRFPIRDSTSILRQFDAQLWPELLDHAPHRPTPRCCQRWGVRDESDLPVRVFMEEPGGEELGSQMRLTRPGRHRHGDPPTDAVLHISHCLRETVREIVEVGAGPVLIVNGTRLRYRSQGRPSRAFRTSGEELHHMVGESVEGNRNLFRIEVPQVGQVDHCSVSSDLFSMIR